MGEERQIQKEKTRTRRLYVAIILIGIALAIILVYPTPHTYSVTEPVYDYVTRTREVPYTDYETQMRRDLERTLNTDGVLDDGYSWEWNLYDLPDDTLYIIVDISSTENVDVEIKDKTGMIYDYTSKDHYYYAYGVGRVLDVKVENPWFFWGPSAVVDGEIRIYHEYYETVPVTKYRTETYQSWEIVDYETSTWTEMKPWWMR